MGLAPLTPVLSVIGLMDVSRDTRILLAYLLLFSIPGVAFAHGYNIAMDTRVLREFPGLLIPAPANPVYLKTYEFFAKHTYLYDEALIIAHSDIARYVHLAIRNPEPSRLIWTWDLGNDTICNIIEDLKAERAIIVSLPWIDITILEKTRCISALRVIDDEYPWILVIEAIRDNPLNPYQ